MNKWFISDTHFSHTNIIRYTGRPFQSVHEMDEQLIANWNAHIALNDTVFFLGDFGLGTTDFLTDLCSGLHGNKICIRGNHDGTPAKMHKIGFSLVLESAFIKVGRHQVELVHIPSHPAPTHFQLFNIDTFRIEFLLPVPGIKNTKIRLGIASCASHPLPIPVIHSRVVINQALRKVFFAPSPIDM